MIEAKSAARLFINRILIDVCNGTLNMMKAQIAEGFPGQADDSSVIENWFRGFDDEEKETLMEVIKIAVKETIFEFLVTLDNASGGPPTKDRISDFAIYIQTYNNRKEKTENQYQEAVRFNSLRDENLHDLFLGLLADSKESQE